MIDSLIQQYAALLEDVDHQFKYAMQKVPEIPCKTNCIECCKQLFPLSIIEAYYINEGFRQLDNITREEIKKEALEKQEQLEKELVFTNYEISNTDIENIAERRNLFAHDMQAIDLDCPLLNNEGLCSLYDFRNHDCRIHGGAHESGEILGCFRHNKIFAETSLREKFIKNTIPQNYRYKEKNKLDSVMIIALTKNPELANIKYITTPYIPLLRNFQETDWQKLFEDKISGLTSAESPHDPTRLSLIIDTIY